MNNTANEHEDFFDELQKTIKKSQEDFKRYTAKEIEMNDKVKKMIETIEAEEEYKDFFHELHRTQENLKKYENNDYMTQKIDDIYNSILYKKKAYLAIKLTEYLIPEKQRSGYFCRKVLYEIFNCSLNNQTIKRLYGDAKRKPPENTAFPTIDEKLLADVKEAYNILKVRHLREQ